MSFNCSFQSQANIIDFDCDSIKQGCTCPPLRANQAVAGPGALWSTVITAGLVLVAAIAYIGCVSGDSIRKFRHQAAPGIGWKAPARNSAPQDHSATPWEKCFQGILVGLSDQALVLGLSILIAALSFGTHNMDSYHFQLAMDLGSLAIGVHVFSLMALNVKYEHDFSRFRCKSANPRAKEIRKGQNVWILLLVWRRFVLVLAVILIIFMWKDTDVSVGPNCPVRCPEAPNYHASNWPGLRDVCIKFILTNSCSYIIVMDLPRLLGEDQISNGVWRAFCDMLRLLLVVLFLISATIAFASCCFAIALLGHDYAVGVSVFSKDELRLENTINFGQLVPLILLMLPFMGAATAYHGSFPRISTERDERPRPKDKIDAAPTNNSHLLLAAEESMLSSVGRRDYEPAERGE